MKTPIYDKINHKYYEKPSEGNLVNQQAEKIKKIKKTGVIDFELLKNILRKVKQILKGRREVMYADIINFIIRHGFSGEQYNSILVWCNYNINLGKVFVDF
ncbi:MAG: hypothetical protein ACFFCE_00350 [Promethearchaeota archaeon]